MWRLSILISVCFACVVFSTPVHAWQEKFEDFVEKNSAGFVVIRSPVDVFGNMETSALLKNRYFEDAMSLLVDEKFSMSSEDRIQELFDDLEDLKDIVSQFTEISVILHSYNRSTPKFSVVLTGEEDLSDRFQNWFEERGLGGEGETEAGEQDYIDEFAKSMLRGLVIKKNSNLILMSNDPNEADKLFGRIEETPKEDFGSLSRNRSFMQVQNALAKRNDTPLIQGYIANRTSKRFSKLLSSFIDDSIDRSSRYSPIETLAGAGFQIALEDQSETLETAEGEFSPVLSYDFVTFFTKPATKYGKLIEAYEPIGEIPELPFDVLTLTAEGYQLNKRAEAVADIRSQLSAESYKRYSSGYIELNNMKGPYVFEKNNQIMYELGYLGTYFFPDNLDIPPLVNMTRGKVKATVGNLYNESLGIIDNDEIRIDLVNDEELAAEFLDQMIESRRRKSKSSKANELEERFNPGGRYWARSGSRDDDPAAQDEEEMPENPGQDPVWVKEYFLDDKYMVKTHHANMKRFLDYYNQIDEASNEEGPRTFETLYDACRTASGQGEFIKVKYRSRKLLQEKSEQNLIERKIRSEMVGEPQREIRRTLYDRLSEPRGEYGLRMVIESRKEAKIAVKQLLLNAFVDTFGTSMRLYTRDDRRLQVFGQIYAFRE